MAGKREILLLVFHTNASKFSREQQLHFTGKKKGKMKILICGFFSEGTILKSDRLTRLASFLIVIHRNCRMLAFLNFSHTFAVNFAIFAPKQGGTKSGGKFYFLSYMKPVAHSEVQFICKDSPLNPALRHFSFSVNPCSIRY